MMCKKKRVLLIACIAMALTVVAGAVYWLGVHLPRQREENERQRLIREYYDAKLGQYRAENDSYADFEVDVAFLGDSLTDGYDLGLYYPQYTVSNRGIGGETSHGLEERIQVSLYDLKPKVAVILIGGNNLKTMLQNYEHMIADIRQKLPQTRVILCSLTAMGRDWAHKNQIAAYNNVIIEKLATRYGCAFVDLYTPLLDVDSGELYAAYTVDGAHLTPAGYGVLTAAITPTLEEQLDLYEGIN